MSLGGNSLRTWSSSAIKSPGRREVTRQTGSHIRLTTQQRGEHHLTIPDHDPLKVGTLSAILRGVAAHVGMTRAKLVRTLFS